jgi:L-methionine (R)-S-oxide reductase
MSTQLAIDKKMPDQEIYHTLLIQIESLLNRDEPLVSNLANVAAVLKEAFDKISWVGFYFLSGNRLYLGPFQGKAACTLIEKGKGVCGTAVERAESIIVENVDEFPGHIACDSGSRSEIVIPLTDGNKILGVLDLDSYLPGAFDFNDKINLEKLAALLTNKLVFNYNDPIITYRRI